MHTFRSFLPLLALALSACGTVTYDRPDMETLMAMMMEAGTPSSAHADLARHVGTWNSESQWWAEPGGEAETMTGVSEIEMIMEGRYLQEHFSADYMGMPFKGMLLMTYDNVTEQYMSIWFDNMSTQFAVQTGSQDESGALQLSGQARDVMTPAGRPMRSVATMPDDDTMAFEMYDTWSDGSEFLVMKITYTRA